MTSDQSVGVRAGFWRRFFAIFIDVIIVLLPFQVLVAVLFTATSGQVQMLGGIASEGCTKLTTLAWYGRLVPPPPAGSNVAQDCGKYFFGAQTARYLVVARVTGSSTTGSGVSVGTVVSRTYLLDRDGHRVEGMTADWMVMLTLIVYWFLMEGLTGATLGQRVVRTRVVDVLAPQARRVPLSKIFIRYLMMAAGGAPVLAVCLLYAAWYGLDFVAMAQGDFFLWFAVAGTLTFAWMVYVFIYVGSKADPIYDRVAGTAVVRATLSHPLPADAMPSVGPPAGPNAGDQVLPA
jgi:hypothetical protein